MSTRITPDVIHNPLSEFSKIGHNTYLWTSPSFSASSPLIVLFTWNAAAAKHIAKYTVSYQRLFPSARILLIRCFTIDMFRNTSAYQKLLTPALDLVHEHSKNTDVLIHSYSNGGGNQLNEFAKAWKRQFGTPLPIRLHIMDSSPTKGPWMQSHAAIAASLPQKFWWRLFGGALIHAFLVCHLFFNLITQRENKMVTVCRELNDDAVLDKTVPRVYLYSKADVMVRWDEAEEHAAIAQAKGWDVTMVKFRNSRHCSHVREDEDKYWGAILEGWKKGLKGEWSS